MALIANNRTTFGVGISLIAIPNAPVHIPIDQGSTLRVVVGFGKDSHQRLEVCEAKAEKANFKQKMVLCIRLAEEHSHRNNQDLPVDTVE